MEIKNNNSLEQYCKSMKCIDIGILCGKILLDIILYGILNKRTSLIGNIFLYKSNKRV